ncbi:MAG: [Fe-Fe] hydrogenase large subunit C-terminal domain-containing protein [Bacilli bacterium]|nr:[Fe-Fe] hydrogenase large subunit C-terminal domain-containing protein [Bacilli bacterium]
MVYALGTKKNDCKNCYKCIRSCPTKSISFVDNQASIIKDDCVLCGKCYLSCPQGAKEIRNDVSKVKDLINSGKKVIVSLAPSFLANYRNSSIRTMNEALKKLGFYDVEETAIGATIVKRAYDEMLNNDDRDIIISSCCHSVNLMIQKHYPECLPYLADVLSPMLAHGKDIKERYKDAYVVFIGPCIAKKDEVDISKDNYVDVALTFIELDKMLQEANIIIENEEDKKIIEKSKARLFPTEGGILKTMDCKVKDYEYISLSGVTAVKNALESIVNGGVHKCFIEMSMCTASCIHGPALSKNYDETIQGYINVSKSAGKEDFEVSDLFYKDIKKTFEKKYLFKAVPSEEDIQNVLNEMGKKKKQAELNCGSCGYKTCREKAIAILQGRAVKEMCLPYLMEKSQSFANNIVYNTPNGLMVLDENLNVQLMNRAMCSLIGIKNKEYILGGNVTSILDPSAFYDALEGKIVHGKKEYLAEYDKYVETTVVYDEQFHILISIMRDISTEYKENMRKNDVVQRTIEITDEVIEKNMRTVQEIANLLGESAAATKVALLSLKETLKDDVK